MKDQGVHFDFILIGSGAGGGTLFQALAQAGKKVLLLERGTFIPQEEQNWDPKEVISKRRYGSPEIWKDENGISYECPSFYCIGGNTKFYGATLMRFRKEDFEELRHFEGVSPAWPLSYEAFEPYYQKAETLYRVRGVHKIDPTEPASSGAYPFPPIPHDPTIQGVEERLKSQGLHPFPLPLAIEYSDPPLTANHCVRCNTCGGYPCKIHAKNDAETICVTPWAKLPNVTIKTGVRVVRLETDSKGQRVTKVHGLLNEKTPESYFAETVVVSAGAINSAGLLLASANQRHPKGLGNSSGLVGKNYMRHLKSSVVGITESENTTRFQKTLGFNDFYFNSPQWKWPLGHVQMLGRTTIAALEAARVKTPAGLTHDKLAKHALEFVVFSEDLPQETNRVSLAPDGTLVVRYHPNNLEGHRRLVEKVKALLPALGCVHVLSDHGLYVGKMVGPDNANHQCGTLRFGKDPKTSVLNPDCRLHDVDNVFVVDSSFMPSSSATNPALTVIANALRVAQKLIGPWL